LSKEKLSAVAHLESHYFDTRGFFKIPSEIESSNRSGCPSRSAVESRKHYRNAHCAA